MVDDRAEVCYNNFIESVHTYSKIMNGCPDVNNILELPYPLFYDMLEKSIKERKREIKYKKDRLNELNQKKSEKTLKTRRGSR